MTIEKAQLRRDVTHEIGVRIDDLSDQADINLKEQRGALRALHIVDGRSQQILVKIAQDFEAGSLTQKESDRSVKYVNMCREQVKSMIVQLEADLLRQEGRISAIKGCVAEIKLMHDQETSNVQRLEKAEKDNNEPKLRQRPVGVHPGQPLKSRRKKRAADS